MTLFEIQRRVRRQSRYRAKLFVQMLTALGYGSVGLAFAEPLLGKVHFGLGHAGAMAVGLASLALALYLVPQGEADDLVR